MCNLEPRVGAEPGKKQSSGGISQVSDRSKVHGK